MLQDAPNHRGTERRGYGVGGNVKGPAAQSRRPNKGHIGYGSGENGTELDALYRLSLEVLIAIMIMIQFGPCRD